MSANARVIRVGLTGGIGSGKSEVARLLAGHGAVIVDADALAREAVAPGSPGLAEVVAQFGADVLARDGSLDRARLARTVFADPERRAALEAVVHPYVARRSEELAAAAPAGSVVVFDVPLIVEKGLQGRYDRVVVVEADPETRVRRLTESRGMPEADARGRIAAQATDEQRRAVADVVVDNGRDLGWLRAQVDLVWQQLSTGA
jgi:dephospho-CoA kinase